MHCNDPTTQHQMKAGGELQYDYIVVGGGTAGCVLAARLSEDPQCTVLLLEAGRDYVTEAELPTELADGRYAVTSGHNWDMQAISREESFVSAAGRAAKVFQVATASRLVMAQSIPKVLAFSRESLTRIAYPMAKVIGGGSSINGAIAFHGRLEDFARWVELGNEWWDWDRVQPFMRCIEAQELHKSSLPVQMASPKTLTSLQRIFLETCLEAGFPLTDSRRGLQDGAGFTPKNIMNGRRVSAAAVYLAPARSRPNLTVQSGCLVDKLMISHREGTLRADGVEVLVEGQRRCFAAKRVVLAAGAINSPAILLRSGIGAREEVTRIGSKHSLHLPGVGKNLMDHPAVFIWCVPDEMACSLGEPMHQVILQQRSQHAARCDLQLFMHSAVPTGLFPPLRDFIGADMAMGISVVLATPVSVGRVEVVSADPAVNPAIHLNCAAQREDVRRLMQGVRLAWRILQAPALRSRTKKILIWNQKILDSDELLEQVITSTVRASWHPTGTLRMGGSDDASAVVDQYGCLHGCDDVTVADASIMPTIPSVPTSLTCMLIGERIAAHLQERTRTESWPWKHT